jgi:hypothetical protein
LVSVLLVIVYWLLKSAVAAVRVTTTVPLPVSVPAPLMTADAAGVKVELLFAVNVPATAMLPVAETAAEDASVKPRKVSDPELAIEEPLLNVTVPPVGANVVEPLTVKAPPTLNEVVGCALGVPAIVRPAKVGAAVRASDQAVPVSVIVPALGLKMDALPVVSAAATEKLLDVVTVADAGMVRPRNVRAPEFEIEEPLAIVIVPVEATRLSVDVTDSDVLTVKVADVVVPLPVIERFP